MKALIFLSILLLIFSGCSTADDSGYNYPEGEINGKCRTTESKCDEGLACISNYCVPDPCAAADCSEWETCQGGICKVNEGKCNSNGDCLGAETCNTTTHECAKVTCDPACDSWKSCVVGSCKLKDGRCDSKSDCGSNEDCDTDTHTCFNTSDPCLGVTCGGADKGECLATNSGAFCDCKPGYSHFDAAGNKILDCINLCEDVTCSGRGECQVISDQPVCTCDGLGTSNPYAYPKDGTGKSIKTECVRSTLNDSLVLHMPLDNSAENIVDEDNHGVTYSTTEPLVCSEGLFQCKGSVSQKCVDNQWVDQENCETLDGDGPSFCQQANGKCGSTSDCTGEETSCLGNVLRTCNGSGYWNSVDCMASGQTCGNTEGGAACVSECTETKSTCHGTKIMTCNAEGVYVESTDCSTNNQTCSQDGEDSVCVDYEAPTKPVKGDLTYVDGLFGKAVNFDGIDDFIMAHTGFNNTSSLSVSVWVKPESVEEMMSLLSSNGQYELTFKNKDNNYVYVDSRISNTTIQNTTTPSKKLQHYITPKTWYLVTMVFEASSQWKIYLNSNEIYRATNIPPSGSILSEKELFIANSFSGENLFKGLMDDLRIYNQALSSSDVQSLSERGAYRICEQTDCGGHGTCKVENYEAICECEEGYYREGLNCKALPVSDGLILFSVMERYGDIVGDAIITGTRNINFYQGVSGMAMNFYSHTGTFFHLNTPNDVEVEVSDKFTLAGWIKPHNLLNDGYILYSTALNMRIRFENGQLLYEREDGIFASTLITDEAWHHIAITVDATANQVVFYIDNKAETFSTDYSVPVTKFDIRLGGTTAIEPSLNALMDEVMMFNRTLSATEIETLFNAGNGNETLCKDVTCSDKGTCAIVENKAVCNCDSGYVPNEMLECVEDQESDIENGLVGYFSFNTAVSDGSTTGLEVIDASALLEEAVAGNGAYFKNSTHQIIISHNDKINFGPKDDFSISLFVKIDEQTDTSSDYNVILSKWTYKYPEPLPAENNYPYLFLVRNNTAKNGYDQNKVDFIRHTETDYTKARSVTSFVGDNTFHHVVLVKRSGRTYIYIDGKLNGVTEDQLGDATENKSALCLGMRCDGESRFSGAIDELRIYNRALTMDEINQLSNP